MPTERAQPTDGAVTMPRLLVIMGSGETSPTMVTLHQQVFAALATGRGGDPLAPVPAVSVDTAYGFQENADELTNRIHDYFAESVGREVEPVRFRSADEAAADPAGHAEQVARLRAAHWVFAGPGSPSYALRTWQGSGVPGALADRLAAGGAVTFASAAALTLGVVTVPVYEVYKVGADPHWLPGLDVLGPATGLSAAVVPHFDNTEGGTHDTRFCYLGERRLARLERELPDGAFVLGVDEHTAVLLDLDARTARVHGRGGLTVRAGGDAHRVPAGDAVTFEQIAGWGAADATPPPAGATPGTTRATAAADVEHLLDAGDVAGAVRRLLSLDADPTADRAAVASLIARVGELAASPRIDRAEVAGPFVDLLLQLRLAARAGRRFDEADRVRDGLAALGVEVSDTPDGATWRMP